MMNMSLVAGIMVNALKRTYDRELTAELAGLGTVAVDDKTKARVWARVEESLKAKGRTGRSDLMRSPTKKNRHECPERSVLNGTRNCNT
jgi:hypothetical protein